MSRFIQAFFIGVLAAIVLIYFYRRDRTYELQIHELRQEIERLSISGRGAGEPYGPLPSPDFSSNSLPKLPLSQQQQPQREEGRHTALTRAVARSANAVVGISVTQVRNVSNPLLPADPFFRMLYDERYWPRTVQQRVESVGSGFITTPDGYIVTNEHVVRNAEKIVVTTTAGKEYEAVIIGTDPLLDMALLKINDTGLPFIKWGDSENAIVGEPVMAIGNPYGLFNINDQPSVSAGVISALHRDFERDADGRLYSDMIQTDASINRGNSGGPLINADGEAVGMNTLIFTESGGSIGVGFAIPAHRIIASIDDLLKGGVDRNYWIGIRVRDLTGISHRILGLPDNSGAIITSVDAGSPAELAGIQVQDVLLEINDTEIKNSADARTYLKNTDLRVGDTINMLIYRRGEQMNLELTLAALPQRNQFHRG